MPDLSEQALPAETLIYFSKKRKVVSLFGYLLSLGLGLFLFLYVAPSKHIIGKVAVLMYPIGAIFTGFSLYFFYISLIGLIRNRPQIVLNKEGMKTADSDFLKWEEITEVEIIRSGKFLENFLCYRTHLERSMYFIHDLDIRPAKLIQLMSAYRWINTSEKK